MVQKLFTGILFAKFPVALIALDAARRMEDKQVFVWLSLVFSGNRECR
jgi:hypothetical protein